MMNLRFLRFSPSTRTLLGLCVCLFFATTFASGQVGGIAPKDLLDTRSPAAAAQVTADRDGQSSFSFGDNGLTVTVRGGPSGFPGTIIRPAEGKAWDLSPFGNVSAQITNTGSEPIRVGLRVDNDDSGSACNTELVGLKPGETKPIKVVFGYSYGFAKAYDLNPASVVKLLFFLGGASENERSFVINNLQAAGVAGEKPPTDPKTVRTKPAGGVLIGPGSTIDAPKQLSFKAGAKAAVTDDGALTVEFPGKSPKEEVVLKPTEGTWNLSDYFEYRAVIRNLGNDPISPGLILLSREGETIVARPSSPIPPGGTGEITIPFAAATPAVIANDPRQNVLGPGTWAEQNWKPMPGTGTTFASNWTRELAVRADDSGKPQTFSVVSLTGHVPPAPDVPEWLGKRPPVDGEWTLTFDQSFDTDAKELDYKTWNIYTHNYWDKRTHFTKDNVILKDGQLILRYEKKTGYHNDNPEDKKTVGKTDYAAGYADTYAKWRQLYGYFEARVKQPKASGLWTAFWLMPDRGPSPGADQGSRASIGRGGMEFDIMEHLTGWGPFRYNVAFHWDGYNKNHKAAGSDRMYVMPDKDGYVTYGVLWLPGLAVYYAQGKEMLRWETPRMCNVPSYMKLDIISGGWDPTPIVDAELPADMVIDYVRAWQRKDLASELDGPMPNDGRPISVEP